MNKQIMDLIQSIQECIQILIASSEEIAEALQAGQETKAMQQLAQYCENFICLVEAIAAIKRADKTYFFDVDELNLRDRLAEMEQAIVTRDYVLLADIVEYEMKELLTILETKL